MRCVKKTREKPKPSATDVRVVHVIVREDVRTPSRNPPPLTDVEGPVRRVIGCSVVVDRTGLARTISVVVWAIPAALSCCPSFCAQARSANATGGVGVLRNRIPEDGGIRCRIGLVAGASQHEQGQKNQSFHGLFFSHWVTCPLVLRFQNKPNIQNVKGFYFFCQSPPHHRHRLYVIKYKQYDHFSLRRRLVSSPGKN